MAKSSPPIGSTPIGTARIEIGAADEPARFTSLDVEGGDARTIDLDSAEILARMIAAARERGDASSFAQLMEVALDLPFWNLSELADHFDVAPSSISKWKSAVNAPQEVLREVVMDDFCEMLGDTFNRDFYNVDPGAFLHSSKIGLLGRRAIADALRIRLQEATAVSDTGFVQNMRAARHLGLASLEAVMNRIGYSEGSLKRWLAGQVLPNRLTRRGFNRALVEQMDRYLEVSAAEANAD
jgi:hypothetical protein